MTTRAGCLDCGSTSETDTILPHGRLCIGCRRRRHYHPQLRAGCDEIRPVAYRAPESDVDICAGCAGTVSIFACREYGSEEHPYSHSRCARCYVRELLTGVMTDPVTGAIHSHLAPVFATLLESRQPQTTL